MGESRVENLDKENRWGNQESKIQTKKPDGGIKSKKSRQENRWGNQESKI